MKQERPRVEAGQWDSLHYSDCVCMFEIFDNKKFRKWKKAHTYTELMQ